MYIAFGIVNTACSGFHVFFCFVYVMFFFQLSLFSGSLLPKEVKHEFKMDFSPSCM